MLMIEITAALSGALSVYFYIIRSHWSWPVGLVQVVLYVGVFAQAKLYADMGLHVIYAVLQVIGWWAWLHARQTSAEQRTVADDEVSQRAFTDNLSDHNLITVKRLAMAGHATCGGAIGCMTALYAYLLWRFTDASLPVPDSMIAAISLVAQWLLVCRYLENWWYWIAVDVLAIAVFSYKHLYVTAALYALFLAMAIVGCRAWWQSWQRQSDRRQAGPDQT